MTTKKDDLANMLKQANAEMMASDPIVRKAFSVALLASDLFVPVHENEEGQSEAGGVNLQAVNIDDVLHVLLFSSQEKLGEFMGQGTRFAKAPGSDILPALRNAHAVLNPGDYGRTFAPEDFAEIFGDAPDSAPDHTSPSHGQPGHVHGPGCGHDH